MDVVRTVLIWMAITLGVCWILLKLFGANRRDERDREEEESHSIFRK